jgi:hypothetical protein
VTFSHPRPNFIESDEGYSVEVLGRTGLRYCEGGRTLFIDSEVLAGDAGIAIWMASIKRWDPPEDDNLVDDPTRRRIIVNVRRAFESKGWPLQVTDGQ